MVEEKESRMETKVGTDLKKATANLKISMDTITKDCVTRLEAQYQQVLQQLTPYDSEDTRRVLDKQVQLLDTLERTNAALVSENSRLRIHHSFMPIRYREEVERMQQQDAQLYREQRRVPKVISPQDTDNHGGTLKLVEAPRAHEMVRRYLHDCEYANIGEIREGIKQSMKLRDNLRKHVVLKKEEHVNAVPLFGSDDNRGKGKSSLRPSSLNEEQSNWKRTDYRSDTITNRSGTFRLTAQAREATRTESTDQQVRDPSVESQRSTIYDRGSNPRRGPNPRRDRSPQRYRSPHHDRSPRRDPSPRRARSPPRGKGKGKNRRQDPPSYRPDEPLPANTKKLPYSHPGSSVPSFPEFNETLAVRCPRAPQATALQDTANGAL
jgi:hypothetical protein